MNEVLVSGSEPAHAPEVFGRYQVVRTLAFGGMAQILLARDLRSGRLVVLKKILPHYAQNHEFVQFFIHEGRLGQRLQHAHIVETIEAGAVDKVPYIALEYLRGKPTIEVLRAAARAKIEMPLGVAVRIVADTARGLHAAHTAVDADGRPLHVVHRDVTPHNLFVTTDGITKVLDFGIAKASSQLHHTRTGTIKGKFAYLAPEQVKGQPIDHRVDVFALGIVLHELLTLRPLFRGTNDGETLQRVLSHEVPPPERVRPGVPPGLGAVALRALQRDRDRRLPSAAALADSIEAVAEAEAIDATPEAVIAFLHLLFPSPGELGEIDDAPPTVRGEPLRETPPEGLLQMPDEASISLDLPRLEAPRPPRVAALAHATSTTVRARRRTAQAALVVAAASVLAFVFSSQSCVHLRHGARYAVPPASIEAARSPLGQPAEPSRQPEPATPQPAQATEARPQGTPPGAPAEATLRVQTDGAASYVVDGRPLKPAGDGALHLAPGHHTVVVSSPALAGPRTLSVDLRPREAALRAVHGGHGTLRLAVTPWADISVDGRTLGVTPLQPAELTEGGHWVTLRNPDLGVVTKRRVVISPNRETVLKVDLFSEKKG